MGLFEFQAAGTSAANPQDVDPLSHDEGTLARQASAWSRLLARRAQIQPDARARQLRALATPVQALWTGLRRLFRDHWDVGVFDFVFGCVKAFAVYPALFMAGLAWTIPLMEYAPLNTQLWTAGYLILRRRAASKWGERRHGVALDVLDAERERALGIRTGARPHTFDVAGRRFTLLVDSNHLLALWRRLRGQTLPLGSIELSELRRWVDNREIVVLARGLRVHDFLYERVLLECALRSPASAARLVARATPVEESQEPALGGLVKVSHTPTRARIGWTADRHATRVSRRFSACSREGLALRWLGWSYQRATERALGEVLELEYAYLADLHRGVSRECSTSAERLGAARERVDACQRNLDAFAKRTRIAQPGSAAMEQVAREIEMARRDGLSVRLARAVAWMQAGRAPVLA